MDPTRALRIFAEIKNKKCGEWKVSEYINCGKSAIVCLGKSGRKRAALKFFDPELIERYGCELQKTRIERECDLIGEAHPHLVKIYDGGCWTAQGLFYVAMEYLPWKNLSEEISKIPDHLHALLVEQIASACKHLETLNLCHRDIKPENIAISPDFTTIKVLDFGVIRPIGSTSITDGTNAKNFIGTLRYSPPEFLLRQEEDSQRGWRAVTFYQIGGVIYDLLERKPLFKEFENPYALLVNAVQSESPKFTGHHGQSDLAQLAQIALAKNPGTRLHLLNWERFLQMASPSAQPTHRSKILERIAYTNTQLVPQYITKAAPGISLSEIGRDFDFQLRLEITSESMVFPPVEIQGAAEGEIWSTKASFPASKQHSLPKPTTCEFQLSWIDQKELIIQVLARWGADIASTPFSPVFSGVFESQNIREPILNILYQAIFENQLLQP